MQRLECPSVVMIPSNAINAGALADRTSINASLRNLYSAESCVGSMVARRLRKPRERVVGVAMGPDY